MARFSPLDWIVGSGWGSGGSIGSQVGSDLGGHLNKMQGGGMGPWMLASAGLNLVGGIMQGRAMQNAANTTAQAGMHQANIAAGAHRDVGKGNIAQSTAARNATFGWGADLDFQRQKAAKMWDKTVGRDLDRDANFRDSKQKIALLTDPDYRASKSREREHEIRKEVARNQAAMAGMFGPISGGFG